MRGLPFFKPKKGAQFAGLGFSDGSGGGGGGSYVLPAASADTLGGVKVGEGLSINGSGVLSVSGGGLTISTTETKIGTYGGSDLFCKMYVFNKYSSGYTDEYVNLDSGNHYVYGTAICENSYGSVPAIRVDFIKEETPRAAIAFNDGAVNLSSGNPVTLVVYYTKN